MNDCVGDAHVLKILFACCVFAFVDGNALNWACANGVGCMVPDLGVIFIADISNNGDVFDVVNKFADIDVVVVVAVVLGRLRT